MLRRSPATPFSTAGMKLRGITPPTIASANSKPAPRSRGSTRSHATANWPWPPRLLLELALGLGRAGDRLAVRRPARLRCRPRTPNLRASFSSAIDRCVSPMPHSSVWCVSGLRSMRSTGSSSCRRCKRVGELVLVALRAGLDRDREHRLRRLERRRPRPSRPSRRARRRCDVSVSLATAAMSPAATSVDGLLLLAAQREELVQALVALGAAGSRACRRCLTVPCSTLKKFTWPDVGVDDRLEHERAPAAPSSATCGAGASSTRNSASRSMPTSFVALPHSTGNTDAVAMPLGERAPRAPAMSIVSSPR